ncbi:hypothetical protein D9757_003762 [Collybiopsis confluens]|uniref:Uncharacterized protein n=1 Tax=Collybiopsis confluens TaxID=2823264 RepID=A0A8H5HVC0_9AGAR|nr:hypothetical protein D9757_003762 [Collybiopsis confluens]
MEAGMIMDATSLTPTSSPQSGRKRNRENETPSQRIKREKAAERQRRKRERDRLGIPVNYVHPPPQRNQQPNSASLHSPVPPPPPPLPPPPRNEPQLTPEEESRRDRVRAAARDRQRKHRALVKQRKMRELGMDMGNDIPGTPHDSPVGAPGQIAYTVDPQAGFHAAMISPPPPGMISQPLSDDPNATSFTPNLAAQGHGGQMFATTLLLSFSCAPLLKQHLLNSLQMSNEELASLEPIIADAWDQWDRQRRQPQQPFDASQPTYAAQQSFVPNQPSSAPPDVNPASATANEFRARFHRSLVVPTPFQAQAQAAAVAVAQAQANAAAAHAAATSQTVSGSSMNSIIEEETSKAQKSDHS